MKFIALVSGGKDSFYAALQAIQNGHELVACLHLAAPINHSNHNNNNGDGNDNKECDHVVDGEEEEDIEESYMYQTAASEVVKTLVEDCICVPLVFYPRKGKSVQTGLVYDPSSSSGTKGSDDNKTPGEEQNLTAPSTPHDEVEDLYNALQVAKHRFPDIQAVSSGAILSTYQRVRIENVCNRLDLTSLSYLWRLSPQEELLPRMIDDGIEAVLVKTACPPGLVPHKHLNKTLRSLWYSGHFTRLHQRYQFHVCGEGGEYESLVLDSPLHKKKLVLDDVEVIEANGDGVGELRILQCHAEQKDDDDIPIIGLCLHDNKDRNSSSSNNQSKLETEEEPSESDLRKERESSSKAKHPNARASISNTFCSQVPISLPYVYAGSGGLLHVNEIMASAAASISDTSNLHGQGNINRTEAELAVEEALSIFSILEYTLRSYDATSMDVIFVHLYLSEMSHFGSINQHYQAFFGSLLPPSRSCVSVGQGVLPGGRRVLLDCAVQIGSGSYMRAQASPLSSSLDGQNPYTAAALTTKTSKLREVLHVQSISHWAPVCVGPYSQVNTLRSCLHFLAGQIGLVPSTMILRSTWKDQLEQCWTNVAAVLDALEGCSLRDIVGSLLYISGDVYHNEQSCMATIEEVSRTIIRSNGSICAGRIDNALNNTEELYGGYEDAGTWEEMKLGEDELPENENEFCPTLVVTIPEMPKGAQVELEMIASTAHVTRYLERCSGMSKMMSVGSVGGRRSGDNDGAWDTGHDFPTSKSCVNHDVELAGYARTTGKGCSGIAFVVASCKNEPSPSQPPTIYLSVLMTDMICCIDSALANARAGLSFSSTAIHVRLFYVATAKISGGKSFGKDDGTALRSALATAIASKMGDKPAAMTVVPVQGIDTLWFSQERGEEDRTKERTPMFAMQVVCLDPVHFETELWIHKDRQYV